VEQKSKTVTNKNLQAVTDEFGLKHIDTNRYKRNQKPECKQTSKVDRKDTTGSFVTLTARANIAWQKCIGVSSHVHLVCTEKSPLMNYEDWVGCD
jgi:hypothetical protein